MSDDRFKALSTDPRYRLPSRKEARIAVDPRFKRLFKDQDFQKKAKVDRYGRKVDPQSGKKDLKKLYRLEKDVPPKANKKVDAAAWEVVGSSDESDSEDAEEDETLTTRRDPAREGGFSESSSEEEDTSDGVSDLDEEAELAEATAGQEQTEEIPMGEVSHRIACVNLDWDNIRAADIMAVASSFVPADGKVESVVVYPSEFGRERMEREELEGPPRDIFPSSKWKDDLDGDGEDSEDEDEAEEEDTKIQRQLQQSQVSEGNEFDTAALRQYQLERLRYYYAVISCSSESCAKRIYDALDGHEYLNTANFFDLRFIPDEVSFEDDKPREECNKLPQGYRPNDFRTEALTHSKVRLTWDDDDPERKEVQKRAFSRAEMDENDMQAYIGSDSSDAESVTSRKSAAEDRKAKKEAERAKMRAVLGLIEEPSRSKKKNDEPVGDMQITFTSGITDGGDKGGVFENEPQDEESTRDRYIRKERERKQKRKERAKAARKPDDEAEHSESEAEGGTATGRDGIDLGFDDPFFNDPEAAAKTEKKAKKADRERKKAAQAAQDDEAAQKRAELELIMADDREGEDDGVRHFDMREVEKAEKEAKRKGKKGKKNKNADPGKIAEGDGFEVDPDDPRFKALFESHEYAIDPTNAKYKKTKGMEKLREEGRRKRKVDDEGDKEGSERVRKAGKKEDAASRGDDEVQGLVARLGGKSKGKKAKA